MESIKFARLERWGYNCDEKCNCDGNASEENTKKTLCSSSQKLYQATSLHTEPVNQGNADRKLPYAEEAHHHKHQCGAHSFTEKELLETFYKNGKPISTGELIHISSSFSTSELRDLLSLTKSMVEKEEKRSMDRALRALHEEIAIIYINRFNGKEEVCESSPCKEQELHYEIVEEIRGFCGGTQRNVHVSKLVHEEVNSICELQTGPFLYLPPPKPLTKTQSPSKSSTPTPTKPLTGTKSPTRSKSREKSKTLTLSKERSKSPSHSKEGSQTPTKKTNKKHKLIHLTNFMIQMQTAMRLKATGISTKSM